MNKRVSLLGATGSIGDSTLKVIDAFPDRFQLQLMVAGRSWRKMLSLVKKYRPVSVAMFDPDSAEHLRKELSGLPVKVYAGEQGIIQAIQETPVDITVSAIVGAAGLQPTMAAIHMKSDVALANKEALVIAGVFVKEAARKMNVQILPVDSEHNAIHQCLRGGRRAEVRRIVLTASGGPFRTCKGDLSLITPQQALKHPTWKMGPKITIDSSTMMNKGLEVIEAYHLFDCEKEQIEAVIHPQSIVHSMVEFLDGSILAQMGVTSMTHPVQYALSYPDRMESPFGYLDFTQTLDLHFEAIDRERFPCIELACIALEKPTVWPCVLNAANEVAVEAFLGGAIKYTAIPEIIKNAMNAFEHSNVIHLEHVLELDKAARNHARSLINQFTKDAL
ncbi:MAG: 1-deoxy-D-xylulose-5-phosphate reductoisomerase [Acidobacteria bacterium]|nr:MAG: 1-deoxy-D-xylulose-5-phosphate reductoisomerase [Acidobacteriota bacterium]